RLCLPHGQTEVPVASPLCPVAAAPPRGLLRSPDRRPVGDLPRQADIVLLRRTGTGALPFQGLWRWLTTWNILEFKGPTVMPRERDLPLLVELGLGIDRRLNAERVRQKQRPLKETDVSFWYIANKLGPRLLGVAERCLGPLEPGGPGVWRASVLGYPYLFVSTVDLPVD